jgi:hypothetical protein
MVGAVNVTAGLLLTQAQLLTVSMSNAKAVKQLHNARVWHC